LQPVRGGGGWGVTSRFQSLKTPNLKKGFCAPGVKVGKGGWVRKKGTRGGGGGAPRFKEGGTICECLALRKGCLLGNRVRKRATGEARTRENGPWWARSFFTKTPHSVRRHSRGKKGLGAERCLGGLHARGTLKKKEKRNSQAV